MHMHTHTPYIHTYIHTYIPTYIHDMTWHDMTLLYFTLLTYIPHHIPHHRPHRGGAWLGILIIHYEYYTVETWAVAAKPLVDDYMGSFYNNPSWESLSLVCAFGCFRRWRDEIQRLQWLRSNEKNQLWMFENRRWSEVMMPQTQMVHLRWVWWIRNGFFREGCWNSTNSDSVIKLWQSDKILNLDSLPIWVCPRAKHQNFWGEDPAAQGKPRCLEPQSRMDPVVLHQHQNPKLVQLLDQIFTPDHHKLVEIAMSTSPGSREICT